MFLKREELKAKCVCENCEPTVHYSKNEWEQFKHYCPECKKSLDIVPDKSGELYPIESVYATDLKIGDYIFCTSRYCQIVDIQKDNAKDNHLYICALNYRGFSINQNDHIRRIALNHV